MKYEGVQVAGGNSDELLGFVVLIAPIVECAAFGASDPGGNDDCPAADDPAAVVAGCGSVVDGVYMTGCDVGEDNDADDNPIEFAAARQIDRATSQFVIVPST